MAFLYLELSVGFKIYSSVLTFGCCLVLFLFTQGQSQSGGHGPGGGKKDDKVTKNETKCFYFQDELQVCYYRGWLQ